MTFSSRRRKGKEMPLLRLKFDVVIDTDKVHIGAGQVFARTADMSQEEWIDVLRDYVGDFPEEVLDMIQDDVDLFDQVADKAQVEFVSWSE